MTYQSIRRSQARVNTPAKWMLIAASVLAVMALFLFGSQDGSGPRPAPEAPAHSAAAAEAGPPAGTEDGALSAPDIDPASLADGSKIPPPAAQLKPSDPEKAPQPDLIEVTPEDLGSPEKIRAFLGRLHITAVTDGKAIINGLLFEAGDFIDKDNRLRFIRRDGGALMFEVNGMRYDSKLPY